MAVTAWVAGWTTSRFPACPAGSGFPRAESNWKSSKLVGVGEPGSGSGVDAMVGAVEGDVEAAVRMAPQRSATGDALAADGGDVLAGDWLQAQRARLITQGHTARFAVGLMMASSAPSIAPVAYAQAGEEGSM